MQQKRKKRKMDIQRSDLSAAEPEVLAVSFNFI